MNRLNEQDASQLADLLCRKWFLDLDVGDKSSTKTIIQMLMDLPVRASWQAVRSFVGIEAMVKNNLDEDADFRLLHEKFKEIPEVQERCRRDPILNGRIAETMEEMKALGKYVPDADHDGLSQAILYLREKGTWKQICDEAYAGYKPYPKTGALKMVEEEYQKFYDALERAGEQMDALGKSINEVSDIFAHMKETKVWQDGRDEKYPADQFTYLPDKKKELFDVFENVNEPT